MSNLEVSRPWPRDTNKVPLYDAAAFAGMHRAGQLAAAALDLLVPHVKPGVTTEALDQLEIGRASCRERV